MEPARIAFVCEGDAEGSAFSGTARRMVEHLRAQAHEVVTVDVRPPRPLLLLGAALSFDLDRARWRARYRYGAVAAATRHAVARARMLALPVRADVVLQLGASFSPPDAGRTPFALYCDWNMALSRRAAATGVFAAAALPPAEMRRAEAREAAIYRRASRIFTISAKLRQSFLEDHGLDPGRVVVAYPGVNLAAGEIPPRPGRRPAERARRILFVGKEFERKGGDVLVAAFREVRRALGDVTLTIIGPDGLQVAGEGVEVVGPLRSDVPRERERLVRAFAEADVFCLPSRVDPFPNVVREAMACGLPCVTTDVFAMPEMVVHGQTGFTAPPGDAAALAARLLDVLRDEDLRVRMGAAGRERVARLFTWERCAGIMHDELERVRLEQLGAVRVA